MKEEKPLLSIGDDGIKMNLKNGDSIRINANKILTRGVEQNAQGGVLEHRATDSLTQIGNKMKAGNDGRILNEVVGGTLDQRDNQMSVDKGGSIVNRVSKQEKPKSEKWWEKTWVQAIMLLGAIAGIVGLVVLFWGAIPAVL